MIKKFRIFYSNGEYLLNLNKNVAEKTLLIGEYSLDIESILLLNAILSTQKPCDIVFLIRKSIPNSDSIINDIFNNELSLFFSSISKKA